MTAPAPIVLRPFTGEQLRLELERQKRLALWQRVDDRPGRRR